MRSTLLHPFLRAALFLLAVTPAQEAAAAAPIKVACVGDSITQLSGWPEMLGAKLGGGYTSTNYGLSGTTLLKSGDHPYWTSQQFTDSHNANPDIVVIMLGTNDSKPFNWTPYKGEFVGDYEALVDSYATLPSHPKIYLNLCPPAGTNGYQIDGTVIENEIIPDIKEVAAAKGLPTTDVFDAFGGHNLDPSLYGSAADLVHPNAKGAQVIAATVYAALTAAPSDGGADGSMADTSSTSSSDAGGGNDAAAAMGTAGAGPSSGASGVGGTASATGGAGGDTTVGGAGANGTGAAGAGAAAGAMGGGGVAGTGAKSPHATSGGCAVAGAGGSSTGLLLALGLLALRRARARRPIS